MAKSFKIIFLVTALCLGCCFCLYAQETGDDGSVQPEEKTEALPAAGQPQDPSLPPSAEKKTGKTIDVLDLQNVSVMQALKRIEEKSGQSVSTKHDIYGTVFVSLQNIAAEDALRIILQPRGFAFYEQGGIFYILSADEFLGAFGYAFGHNMMTKTIPIVHIDPEEWIVKLKALKSEEGRVFSDRRANVLCIIDHPEMIEKMEALIRKVDIPLATKTFYLRYAQLNDMKTELKFLMTEEVGRIETFPALNKITVTDTAEKIEAVAKYIQEADRKIEVAVEVGVVQIRLNEEYAEGVDWEAIVSDYQELILQAKRDNIFPEKKQLSVGTVTNEDYAVLLEALDTVGEMTTLLNFNTIAIVNSNKKINLDTGKPFQKISSSAPSPNLMENSFEIQMGVRPTVQAENLTVDLFPELYWVTADPMSSDQQEVEGYEAQASVAVSIEKDETIVIGGLVREEEVSRTAKLPLLGDLPLVGLVFRHQSRLVERIEYVIFLTPKIVKEEKLVTTPPPQ